MVSSQAAVALVTVVAALVAGWAREAVLARPGGGRVAQALPLVAPAAGALIALAALGLPVQSLGRLRPGLRNPDRSGKPAS